MKINIRIFEDEEKMKVEYNDKITPISFEMLVKYSNDLLELDNFENLTKEDLEIEFKPEHEIYANTFKDILEALQGDNELKELLKDGNEEIEI